MCRIFCSPDKNQTFTKCHMWEYLDGLEKAMGKDGNGVYNFTTKELWKSHKRMPKEANIKGGFLFHTRWATNGLIRDYNCQPFVNERYVFVHNGVFNGIESYARLLGFQYSSKKYSDSYMMAWVMEKVGILNFYNAFRDKHYGVVVVLDKETDKIYLLKTGGSFEYGVFEDGIHIYASSDIDFWRIKDKAEDFDNGLFILSGKGFKQLDKIVSRYYSGYGQQGRFVQYNSGTSTYTYDRQKRTYVKTKKKVKKKVKQKKIATKLGDRLCTYCLDKLDKNHTYIHYGNKICEICNDLYEERDGEGKPIETEENCLLPSQKDPMGIAALFFKVLPKVCDGCNWIFEKKCWFGGVKHDEPVNIPNPEDDKIICYTKTSPLDLLVQCETCKANVNRTLEWGIVDGLITCEECIKEEEKSFKSCNDCEYYLLPSREEPCGSCWSENGIARNWTERGNPCDGCYFENSSGSGAYPCKMCEDTGRGPSEWTQKNGKQKSDENINMRCALCKETFNEWDTPYEDGEGDLICETCYKYGYVEEEGYDKEYGQSDSPYEDDRYGEDWDEWDYYKGR